MHASDERTGRAVSLRLLTPVYVEPGSEGLRDADFATGLAFEPVQGALVFAQKRLEQLEAATVVVLTGIYVSHKEFMKRL